MKLNNILTTVVVFLFLSIFTSCTSTRDVVYFNNVKGTEFLGEVGNLEPVIQQNDILSISVTSLNPAATEIFNVLDVNYRNSNATSNVSQAVGYLVDQDGYILFPFLGKVKAAGLTKKEVKESIRMELINRKLLLDPIVDLRYLNYKVSVLGEVGRPSVLTVPNEKITLLEALSLAGDLTIYANRDNVLLIREEQGVKKLTRINLTTDELFTSPYYYLKSNDIIYVEPNKTKIQNAGFARQWLPVVFSGLSVAVIAIDRLTR
ncbi:polysaccharide biosynthesis/export family protein [Pontibacter silvestris]|uniref:Polysaccharide biosynthesis/export family protein n=1 Tax=Pontibacter silvestris TaxID=2305183 RepID=A0ABW4WXI1_9BACT|nr:polysaccharide biosynthesis/export family protein [Pontibacter silvestris]MCC9138537.1 polysaccharide biosynthesis/export family protein [Pontibacter silvestris]